MESKFKKDLKYYLIAGAVSLALAIGFFCLFFFARGNKAGYGLVNWQDSLMISGLIIAGVGGLMWIGREGFFDIFAYGFKQLGGAIFSKNPRSYNDYPGYREEMKNKRSASPKTFLSVLIIGAAFLLAALCVYFVYLARL